MYSGACTTNVAEVVSPSRVRRPHDELHSPPKVEFVQNKRSGAPTDASHCLIGTNSTMRLSYIVLGLLVATTASAKIAAIIGAVKGITALSASVAKLVGTVVPAGLLLPFAVVGPLKLSLPMLFALKGLGLLKFKLIVKKMPLLAPVGLATAKFSLLKAKYGLGKTALGAVGKAKVGLIHLPVKLTSAKIGAVTGAVAGAKAGLAAYKTKPKGLWKAALLPSETLFSQSKSLFDNMPRIPMKNITVQVKHVVEHPVPVIEVEPEESNYGRKPPAYTPAPPAYTPAPPAYTPAPPAYTPAPPAYTPAPPAYTPEPTPQYRKRRDASSSSDQLTTEALNSIFAYIQTYDSDRCVHRLVCELAVQPELAGTRFADVTEFMTSLPSDPDAPWMSYKAASATGTTSRDRTVCAQHYAECERSTETLIETATSRLAGVDI